LTGKSPLRRSVTGSRNSWAPCMLRRASCATPKTNLAIRRCHPSPRSVRYRRPRPPMSWLPLVYDELRRARPGARLVKDAPRPDPPTHRARSRGLPAPGWQRRCAVAEPWPLLRRGGHRHEADPDRAGPAASGSSGKSRPFVTQLDDGEDPSSGPDWLDEALVKLGVMDPRLCEMVHLRFFAGLTVERRRKSCRPRPAPSNATGASARGWLHRELVGGGGQSGISGGVVMNQGTLARARTVRGDQRPGRR